MSLKYPIAKKYKVQQSQIRYNYNSNETIKRKALKYLFAYKQRYSFHKVKSHDLIDILEYFINIIKKWDEHSKKLNGWTSCYLTIKILRIILNGLKLKFGLYQKEIKFSNVEAIYQIIDRENPKIIPINNLLYGLLIATEEYSRDMNFYNLLSIAEVMAKNQMIYLIANYKSRKRRSYKLPWETINDPIIQYRKLFKKKREKLMKFRQNMKPDTRQTKISNFFKINDSEDKEILDLLDYLDTDKENQVNFENLKKTKNRILRKRKLDENNSECQIKKKRRKKN